MRRFSSRGVAILALVVGCVAPAGAGAAVMRGQVDAFEDGTTDGWTIGKPLEANTPTYVPTGGPAGDGDGYLKMTATGNGLKPGGHMVSFNRLQWAGNYTAARVNAIEMDLRNFSGSPMVMRIAIKSDVESSTGWATSDASAVRLTNDGKWHHVVFPLTTRGMAGVGITTPPSFSAQMANVRELRILSHANGPWTDGEITAGSVGVDNVRALPVPEPGGAVAWFTAPASVLLSRRRRRR